jgi:hypothetical protein
MIRERTRETTLGNLGKYQDFAVAAKEAGGVDKLIEQIEKGAVSKAAPRIRRNGALVGAALCTATWTAAMAAKHHLDSKKAREALAEDAKAELKAAVEGPPSSEGAGRESDEDTED